MIVSYILVESSLFPFENVVYLEMDHVSLR